MCRNREEEERLTMQARIEAFYKQSGGPNNPQVKRVLEKHLLFGKDHGPPGRRETIEDAFVDTVVTDPSNLVFLQWFQRARQQARQSRAGSGGAVSGATAADIQRLEADIAAVRKELAELKELLKRIAAAPADSNNTAPLVWAKDANF